LTRQKANFSHQFKYLPDTDENKKKLLEQRLIYPDFILDEIVAEIVKVQAAYDVAKNEVIKAYENKKPVEVFESITFTEYFN
jgi:isocitrate dehydrogenase